MRRLLLAGILLLAPQSQSKLLANDDDVAQQIAQLRTIKQRMVATYVAARSRGGLQEAKGGRDAQVTAMLATPREWWSAFSDINQPEISFNGSAWQQPALLARAWADPSGQHHHSERVLASMEQGLRHLQQFAYPGCPRPNNWWAWRVGLPMRLLETLLLTEGSLAPDLRQQAIDTLAYVLKLRKDLELVSPARLPLIDAPGKTDMNALWNDRISLQLALVVENPAMAGKWAQLAMSEVGRAGDGFLQADYSYKFHGASPMWAYGRAFLADYADLIEIYRGTAFGPKPDQLDRFAEMSLHYVNGFLYRGSICPAMVGREVSRGDDLYHSGYGPPVVRALASLAHAGHPKAAQISRIITRERGYFREDPAIAAEETGVASGLETGEPAPPVDDIFAYPDSDFLQITRPGWAVGIKMHSKRNRGYESINGENLQGWFLSHGSLFHLIGGNEWKGCWPTLDWARLPGTTVAASEKSQNTSPFVGVLRASRQQAIAAMELACGGFKARKSWIIDGDVIVCLGSNISGAGRVETTLFNQPVARDAKILADGKPLPPGALQQDLHVTWVWLEGVGYVLPPGQTLHVSRQERSSDWTSVREAHRHGAGERSTMHYLTAVLEHNADSREYRYFMLPDVTAEQMPQLAHAVLKKYELQTDGPHHVTASDGWEACVFWEAGHAGGCSADTGCLVWREGDHSFVVDPTWQGRPLHVTINNRPTEVRCEKGRPFTVAP